MPKVKCGCTSEHCRHSPNICRKTVYVTIRLKVAVGPSQFTEAVETGVCEQCYDRARRVIPWAFPKEN
jgi:hypothetical protein